MAEDMNAAAKAAAAEAAKKQAEADSKAVADKAAADAAEKAKASPKRKTAVPDADQRAGRKLPTIGEAVHYVLPFGRRGEHRPMTVTSVAFPERLSVRGHVLLEPGDLVGENVHFAHDVPYDPAGGMNTWHYVEQADD